MESGLLMHRGKPGEGGNFANKCLMTTRNSRQLLEVTVELLITVPFGLPLVDRCLLGKVVCTPHSVAVATLTEVGMAEGSRQSAQSP